MARGYAVFWTWLVKTAHELLAKRGSTDMSLDA